MVKFSVVGCTTGEFAAAIVGSPDAVLNKLAPNRCGQGGGSSCDSFADIAHILLTDQADFGQFAQIMRALIAVFFLACLACMASGCLLVSQGTPGGGQRMMAGCWGVVVVIACVGVIL
jgi:hypothetical protein